MTLTIFNSTVGQLSTYGDNVQGDQPDQYEVLARRGERPKPRDGYTTSGTIPMGSNFVQFVFRRSDLVAQTIADLFQNIADLEAQSNPNPR